MLAVRPTGLEQLERKAAGRELNLAPSASFGRRAKVVRQETLVAALMARSVRSAASGPAAGGQQGAARRMRRKRSLAVSINVAQFGRWKWEHFFASRNGSHLLLGPSWRYQIHVDTGRKS